LGIIYIGIKYI